MHVTIGTLLLTFCWARHYLASMLPEDVLGANSASVLTKLLSTIGYVPSNGRK